MNTIQQTVTIPADRRLRLDIELPDTIPAGRAEMVVVLSPVQEPVSKKPLNSLAGSLADSATFAGDPVQLQRAMRDEW